MGVGAMRGREAREAGDGGGRGAARAGSSGEQQGGPGGRDEGGRRGAGRSRASVTERIRVPAVRRRRCRRRLTTAGTWRAAGSGTGTCRVCWWTGGRWMPCSRRGPTRPTSFSRTTPPTPPRGSRSRRTRRRATWSAPGRGAGPATTSGSRGTGSRACRAGGGAQTACTPSAPPSAAARPSLRDRRGRGLGGPRAGGGAGAMGLGVAAVRTSGGQTVLRRAGRTGLLRGRRLGCSGGSNERPPRRSCRDAAADALRSARRATRGRCRAEGGAKGERRIRPDGSRRKGRDAPLQRAAAAAGRCCCCTPAGGRAARTNSQDKTLGCEKTWPECMCCSGEDSVLAALVSRLEGTADRLALHASQGTQRQGTEGSQGTTQARGHAGRRRQRLRQDSVPDARRQP